MMQSPVFGLCIITSAYYSLRKWDHLQMNRFSWGVKLYNYNFSIVTYKDVEVIIASIRQCNFCFPWKSHASEQTNVTSRYFSVSS